VLQRERERERKRNSSSFRERNFEIERERERVLGGRGTEGLMIERQELVETGGGHMGGGPHFHTPQLIVA
jgi:hypothetical protein